jgi:hypothetical protein
MSVTRSRGLSPFCNLHPSLLNYSNLPGFVLVNDLPTLIYKTGLGPVLRQAESATRTHENPLENPLRKNVILVCTAYVANFFGLLQQDVESSWKGTTSNVKNQKQKERTKVRTRGLPDDPPTLTYNHCTRKVCRIAVSSAGWLEVRNILTER